MKVAAFMCSFLFSFVALFSYGSSGKVVYLSFSGSLDHQMARPADSGRLSTVESTDDTPMEKVILPFSFPYFGRIYNRVFVNANGAVVLSNEVICENSENFCTMNSDGGTFFGSIAGILIDLFPGYSNNDVIAAVHMDAVNGQKKTEISFYHVPYFAHKHDQQYTHVDMAFSLYSDGQVSLSYFNLNVSGILSKSTNWISGLRPPNNDDKSSYVLTSAQLATSRSDWGSNSFDGVYPERNDVRELTYFTACPVSLTWCMTPTALDVSQNSTHTVKLNPLSISCNQSTEFAVYALQSSNVNLTVGSPDVGLCTLDGSAPVLSCDVSAIVSLFPVSTSFPERLISFGVLWRPVSAGAFHSSLFSAVEDIPPLSLMLQNTSVVGPSECSLNMPYSALSTSSNNSCQNDKCNLCSGNLTCLGLPCSGELYRLPKSCPSLTNDQCSIDTWFDNTGACCSANSIDCQRLCANIYTAAVTESSPVCVLKSEVDCKGVYLGKTVVDACGVCGGSDTEGVTCPDSFAVHTYQSPGINNHSIYVTYPLSNPRVDSPLLLMNNNETYSMSVYFEFNSDNTESKQPKFELPMYQNADSAYILPPLSTLKVEINSSFLQQGSWEVKTLKIVRRYVNITSPIVRYYSIYIYPAVSGCAQFNGDSSSCLAYPGCSFCPYWQDMRVLKAQSQNDPDTQREEVPDDSSAASLRGISRRLFNVALPDPAGATGSPDNTLCIDGWDTNACPAALRALGLYERTTSTFFSSDEGSEEVVACAISLAVVLIFVLITILSLYPKARARFFSRM
jgi:hypothetical protein